MNRLKSHNKQSKMRSADVTQGQAALSELQAQARHVEELLRAKELKLADLKTEFAARAGNADRGSVALRQELGSLQESLSDCRLRHAEAEAAKRQLEQSVRASNRLTYSALFYSFMFFLSARASAGCAQYGNDRYHVGHATACHRRVIVPFEAFSSHA